MTWFLESPSDINNWPELLFLSPFSEMALEVAMTFCFLGLFNIDPGLLQRHPLFPALKRTVLGTQNKQGFATEGRHSKRKELLVQRAGGTKQFCSLKLQVQHDEQMGESGTDAKELDMVGDVSPCRDRCTRLWREGVKLHSEIYGNIW